MLLSHVCGLSRVQLITCSEHTLSQVQAQQFSTLLQQRLAGTPIAYLLGSREFFGLNFKVTPDVLIPRPDTELLVELALQYTPTNGQLLDLGTGSGAIAIAVGHTRSDIQVTASDISPAALTVAKHNATTLLIDRAPLTFFTSDWYSQIPPQIFNTIVSNPPYIVKDDPHLDNGDLRFEPINALTDHGDGLSAYRQIIQGARSRLQDSGWLLMEHGYDQAEAVQALLRKNHFEQVTSWQDLAGIWRVTGARYRASTEVLA
ncbi:MAG: peptide chain release factor N(5)-glutamine methyltransferase [Undibacterium sp.]|nr:peptide chain release factor N(5)-glutamine methyltransferase [Undibacterium sp.]